KAVYGDGAYDTHARRARLQARGIKPRLARRPNKHHPKLPPRLRRYNRLVAVRRSAVETTFATWKNRMGFTAIRYVGLVKASAQVLLSPIAFNMRRWVATAGYLRPPGASGNRPPTPTHEPAKPTSMPLQTTNPTPLVLLRNRPTGGEGGSLALRSASIAN